MNRHKYINEEIIDKLVIDDVNKMAELIQAQPSSFLRAHASYIVAQLFKWPYDYVRKTYDRSSYLKCAKYMLILFTFTDDQYIYIALRVLNIYLYSDKPDVDYQNKIIDILRTCIGHIKNRNKMLSRIPRCFNNIRPQYRTVDHCINDSVIMYCIELIGDPVVIHYRVHIGIFLEVIVECNPTQLTRIIAVFIEDPCGYQRKHHERTVVNLITPMNCRLIDDNVLNNVIFENIENNTMYPVIVKLMQCGYNMPKLYRYVRDRMQAVDDDKKRADDDKKRVDDDKKRADVYSRTRVWKLLVNFI